MGMHNDEIPDASLEAIARNFFRDTKEYGFKQVDYLRFINHLLELSVLNGHSAGKAHEFPVDYHIDPPPSLPLIGEHVRVRAFSESTDRARVETWLKDPEGKYFLLSRTTATREHLDRAASGGGTILGVITLTDGTPVGLLAFLNVDQRQGKAELRKMIGEPAHRGKGLAREATQLWLGYGVSALGLRKIYVDTLDNNVRNIHLNEKLGFKVEGLLRAECVIDGEQRDILRMALLIEPQTPRTGEDGDPEHDVSSGQLDQAVTESM